MSPLDGITVVTLEQAVAAPYGPHRTAGGEVFLGIQNEREWVVFCQEVLGRPEVAGDPCFHTNDDRVAHRAELTAIIENVFEALDADQVVELLDRAGIANARLRTPAELTRHPQLTARDRWRPVATPGGEMRALLPPVEVAGWEPAMGAVPALGEHTQLVRQELGMPE